MNVRHGNDGGFADVFKRPQPAGLARPRLIAIERIELLADKIARRSTVPGRRRRPSAE